MNETSPPIPLESYARVLAATSAGLPHARALAHADVLPGSWDAGAAHWQAAIDESAASDLAVLVAFDVALLEARRAFEPRPEPIATEVRAWVCFRRHVLSAVDPGAFIASQGLSLSSYARLEGEWANRAAASPEIEAALAAELDGPLGPCPAITLVSPLDPVAAAGPVSAAPHTAPPHTAPPETAAGPISAAPHTAPPPTAPPETAPPSTAPIPAPPEVPLERYAVMLADTELFPMSEQDLCQKHGITPQTRAHAFGYWRARAAVEPAVAARIQELVDRYRAVRAPQPASSHAPASRTMVGTTADLAPQLVAEMRRQSPLPFAPPRAGSDPPAPSSVVAPPPSQARPRGGGAAQTVVFDGRSFGPALPFEHLAVEGLGLDAYARVAAELAGAPDRLAVLRRNGVADEATFQRIQDGWKRLISERDLTSRYVSLFARHHERVASERRETTR